MRVLHPQASVLPSHDRIAYHDGHCNMSCVDNNNWIELCPFAELPSAVEGGRYVTIGNRALAVYRAGEESVRVMDDACPHAGASLASGFLEDGCVVCRYHAWAFDIDTGLCPDNPAIGVRVYESRVKDGVVWVRLPQ